MKKRTLVIGGMALAWGLALGGEAFARGGAGQGQVSGDQLRLRDGSCLTAASVTQPAQSLSTTATPIRQKLQDGSCQTSPCDGTPDRLRDRTGAMNGAGYGIGDVLPATDELGF